jgi:hypothetical protein
VPGPEGFDYEVRGGEVVISHHGRRATVLRGNAAARFLADVEDGDESDGQELMARVTGNYRRGNERRARSHPRNAGG